MPQKRRYSELLVRRPFRSSWIWSFGKRCATWNGSIIGIWSDERSDAPQILYKHILVNGILNSVKLFCWLEVSCKFWSFLWKLANSTIWVSSLFGWQKNGNHRGNWYGIEVNWYLGMFYGSGMGVVWECGFLEFSLDFWCFSKQDHSNSKIVWSNYVVSILDPCFFKSRKVCQYEAASRNFRSWFFSHLLITIHKVSWEFKWLYLPMSGLFWGDD